MTKNVEHLLFTENTPNIISVYRFAIKYSKLCSTIYQHSTCN